ncbi:MAG: aldehyde dehydrogenase EutE [Defluviitaleaceae bacterium]|nr:aldehyde dehydrogenase EutE [Defluviitaleaceae bacterium]
MLQNPEALVNEIVSRVVANLSGAELKKPALCGNGIFSDMDQAVEACVISQKQYVKLTHQKMDKIINAIKQLAIDNAELLSKMAVEETGLGNYNDKVIKNRLVGEKTPGLEDLKSESFTGDNGLTLIELSPFGIIGSITPTTNPSETILCNSIGMLAAGNGVVFSPHPKAKEVSKKTVELINKAIVANGGPANLVTTVADPSMDQAKKLMEHPRVDMLVATGGPGVVKAVLASGKKAIGAGAGNPPVIVDDTADIVKAADDIVKGASFDNNIVCVAEKEVIALKSICDYLIFQMQASGAHLITTDSDLKKLENLVLEGEKKYPHKDFIGKDAKTILQKAGIDHKPTTKLIIVETKKCHPFVQREMMMPVLPIVRADNINEAIEMAIELEHGYRHTAVMHSKNIDNLSAFAKAIQTTIFVKNGPAYAGLGVGGEGYTTFTIAGPTGEGLTAARHFTRKRRCVLVEGFNIR